jgi:excisionase family DNA binding protein
MDHESEEYLLASEAAELLGGVTPKTVSRWAKEGKLPYLRTLGGHRRYPATPLRELAASLGYQPDPHDADASDGLEVPDEGGPMMSGDFPADPTEPPPGLQP